ncbi:uncharacterized protein LOC143220301, partial [Lasioglossum baleicum]|uniref:uncharacterized protein LOC143220301 n=1 Tax=Lasioglossum baleicum TaxID=434251 RepID=UPI003FCDB488
RINDIDAECSEDDQEIQDMENDNTENYGPFKTNSKTDEDEGNISNEVKLGSNPGSATGHIFRETSGPIGYSKRNTIEGEVGAAFSVIIYKNIIEHIRKCTEAVAFRVLGYKWEQPTAKLYAFFAIMYARGVYEAKDIDIALL